jgi:protein-disulfide isomerase
MRNIYLILAIGIFILAWSSRAAAGTPTCSKLNGAQKALAKELLESQHAYACCDETLANCLKREPVCALVHRLAENICKRVIKNQDKEKIVRSLSRRARSMMPQKRAPIDLANFPAAGEETAPVVLVAYACARCPFCARLIASLHRHVVSGSLKGKARLYLKPFPIRGHGFSKETGLAFVAAAKLGRYWEFVLYSYDHFDTFRIEDQNEWAELSGMDRGLFAEAVASSETRDLLVKSKKEGIVNKVDATPTLFLNGRKYVGDLNPREIIDVVEEEYQQLKGIRYHTPGQDRGK